MYSVTLLAATWCEQNCPTFDETKALTKEHVACYMNMLSFGKNPAGHFDTCIQGLGLDTYVSGIQNTTLKSPKVSKNIPTVRRYTQGEVIWFAARAVQTLGNAGITVLLEGREETVVTYVRTRIDSPLLCQACALRQSQQATIIHVLSNSDCILLFEIHFVSSAGRSFLP